MRSVGEGEVGVDGWFVSVVLLARESCQGWVTSALQTGHWMEMSQTRMEVTDTYEFLAIDQPGVDFVEVKNVMAWEFADTIALYKLKETNGTFELGLAPRDRVGAGGRRVTLIGSLDVEREGWTWVGDSALVLFPGGAIPDAPGEALDEMLWCAVALGGTCHADTVYEEGDKGETGGEDENDDKGQYGAGERWVGGWTGREHGVHTSTIPRQNTER